jgi:hypothetical protein
MDSWTESLIMNLMSRRVLLLFTIAALGLVSPAPLPAWQLDDLELNRVATPSVLDLDAATNSADFDENGREETLTSTGNGIEIGSGSQIRWESPPAWQVEQARVTDLNRDGIPEATLLVWRPFKPWPVDAWLPNGGRIDGFHDSRGMSCHIILIGWKQGSFRELWAGSAMVDPVKIFTAADLAGNGQQYLVTLEGRYDDPPSAPARRLKVWEWNGFGFTNVNELEKAFSLMGTAKINDRQVLILSP